MISGPLGDKPIWYGALYQEAFHQPWQLVTLGTTTNWPDASVVPQLLPADMQVVSRSTMQDGSVRRAVVVSRRPPKSVSFSDLQTTMTQFAALLAVIATARHSLSSLRPPAGRA